MVLESGNWSQKESTRKVWLVN